MLRLRPFRADDAEKIVTWTHAPEEFYRWSAGILGEFPLTGHRLLEALAGRDNNTRYFPFTAFDEGGPVGFFIMRQPGEDDRVVRFGFVIIDPAKRGLGYGKQMLSLGLKYAFEIYGADCVNLGVFEQNLPAYSCYKSLGFRETGVREQVQTPAGCWTVLEMDVSKEKLDARQVFPV